MRNINKLTNGINSENSIFLSQIKGLDTKLHLKYDNSDSIIGELFRRADEKMHLKYPHLLPKEDVHDYSKDYLTIIPLEDCEFHFDGVHNNGIQYSVDNGMTWTTLAANVTSPKIIAGTKILLKQMLTPVMYDGIGNITVSKEYNIQGNIMSLLYGDNFENQTDLSGKNYVFAGLFRGPVISAENLVLPATTLADHCYYNMFSYCKDLTIAPKLPATTLTQNCYDGMFNGCTNLTTAPELPATTLVDGCYYWMFQGCTNLNYIKCLATDISATDCTTEWVYGVASNGTFVKADGMESWTSGTSGIPDGWTVENA